MSSSAANTTPYYKTAKPTARITSVEKKAPGCRMKKTKHQLNLEKLHHLMKQTDISKTDMTAEEVKDWDRNMAHAARVVDPPYRGDIDMALLEDLFADDKDIFPLLSTPLVKGLLLMQLNMEAYPDKEFDELRGKFENETLADIKRRYTAVLQEFLLQPLEL